MASIKKNVVLGILAHVDAGKTTLSEGLLYSAGATDRLGRVDKRDTHLDTDGEERRRGITIFSKHEEWIQGYKDGKKLIINVDDLKFEENPEDFQKVLEMIEKASK